MIIEFLESIAETILNSTTIGIVLGALIAGYFGFYSYKRQKERDNINKRYFEEGLENFITYLNHLRISIEDHYVTALINLKYLRDLKVEDFKKWFKESDFLNKKVLSSVPTSFLIASGIFGDENFNKLCVNIFVDCGDIDDLLVSETLLIIKKYIENPAGFNKNKLVDDLKEKIVNKYEKTYKEKHLYKMIQNLEKILLRLREMNIDSYKKLRNAEDDKKIKELLTDLKK